MSDLDARVFRLVHAGLSGPGVLAVMAALTILGSGWSMLALLPLFAAPRTRRLAASLALTLASTSIVVALAKLAVGRARPCACLAGVQARVFAAPTDFSFPSGHAAGAFAFAAFASVLLLERPGARPRVIAALLFAVAAGVALSRVALGVHFPGDVAAGALVGAALGAIGARVSYRGATKRTSTAGESRSKGSIRNVPSLEK